MSSAIPDHPTGPQSLSLDVLHTESDVEQKVLFPLLTNGNYLDIPTSAITTKQYLAAYPIDKAAGKTSGYYPDYCIHELALPILTVEAKAPNVNAAVGYREAALYARHLNQSYKANLNPCRFILSCNGSRLLAGYWDSTPEIDVEVEKLLPGTSSLEMLRDLCGHHRLLHHARTCLAAIRFRPFTVPYRYAGGRATINSKKPFNTFAAELSPILRKYFTSTSHDNDPEIYERAYVSSDAVTAYDGVLESLLKDRISTRRGSMTQNLHPTRSKEPKLTSAIDQYNAIHPDQGQLQLITGSVGVGKSLFARRYKELLQDQLHAKYTHWAFIDFNTAPSTLRGAEDWVCRTFIESFQREDPNFDVYDPKNLPRIFSHDLQKRRGVYSHYRKVSPERAKEIRAHDLDKWLEDPKHLASAICRYFSADKRETIVAVFDNVDRLDLENQLAAFQLALWFLNESSAFVMLQMRDETYERYKERPPLDTFRSGVSFHITPPRFLDVVKRRLELSLDYLVHQAEDRQEYYLSNGSKVIYPKSLIGEFLKGIYLELFERRNNIARILQGIAGRDVRRALEMFVAILTSGHLREESITSAGLGAREITIPEYVVLRILMRTEYRFFNNDSGFVTNIFHVGEDWVQPNNFLLCEIIFWLFRNRKARGSIGLEGYYSIEHIASALRPLGCVREDVLSACSFLVRRQLIEADHMNQTKVDFDDSVKVNASGFIHLRILCERMEYLYGVLSVTPLSDDQVARRIGRFIQEENDRDGTAAGRMSRCIKVFLEYLRAQHRSLRTSFPGYNDGPTGASFVLQQVQGTLDHFNDRSVATARRRNLMDE